MRLNIFFLTIIIKRRKMSLEEALRREKIEKIFEEKRRKVEHYTRQH